MEQKQLIIIGVICVTICILAGAIFGILTNTVKYERIEITPNGTTIEVPSNNLTFQGDINNTGFKIWTFKQGSLTSYNSDEGSTHGLVYMLGGAYGFKESMDLIKNHFEKQERIEDYLVYTIDTDKLNPDGGSGLMYCIIIQNNESHDNMIIVASSKEIALHIAKSVQFKALNITGVDNPTSSSGGVSKTAPTKNNSKVASSDVKGEDYWLSLEGKAYEVDDCPSENVVITTSDSSSQSYDYNPEIASSG